MPIYEYRCHDCRRRVSIFWRNFSDLEADSPPRCPRCGGTRLTRLISRVAVLRSEEGHLDDLTDPGMLAGLDDQDPRSIARWMRRMSRETGEDLGPEFDQVVDRLEAGESPEDIEAAMPELGGDLEPTDLD
ncbi:MAG: FmdB family zinc ribbon protein [Chloroflexota bacterium]